MAKLLILDKDGTLIRPKSGAKFVRNPEDQELIPGVKETIARYVAAGWSLAIASNQGGVAAGHKTLEDAIVEMTYCMDITSDRVLCACFCPDNGETCWEVYPGGFSRLCPVKTYSGQFRKPAPGMLRQLIERFQVWGIVTDVLFVGNCSEDFQAAAAAGIPFMRVNQWLDRSPF